MSKTFELIKYMKARADFEENEWDIPDSYIDTLFVQKGTRIFFGVVLDDLGRILEDRQNPEFYNKYKENLL